MAHVFLVNVEFKMLTYFFCCCCRSIWKRKMLKFSHCHFGGKLFFRGKKSGAHSVLFNALHVSLSNLEWFVCFSVLYLFVHVSLLIHLSFRRHACVCGFFIRRFRCSFRTIFICKVETIRKCVSQKVAKQYDDNNALWKWVKECISNDKQAD